MNYYALITPTNTGSHSNPGWHYITAGIEHLVRRADPESSFVEVSMLGPDPAWDIAAANCRAMFFCGNPRFNTVEEKTYWDWDIWEKIVRLMDSGVPLIDAWAGSAHPLPIPSIAEMVHRIGGLKKTAAILAYEKKALLCIARDAVAFELLSSVNRNTVFWPCSTWWAAEEMALTLRSSQAGLKTCNVIALRRVGEWQVSFVRRWFEQLSQERPTILLTHCHQDWEWFRQRLPDHAIQCVTHPRMLLHLLARAWKCISFRTHVSIPALSVGAQVADISIDSRSMTLEPLGVVSASMNDACHEAWQPQFATATAPDRAPIVKILRETLQSIT